MKENYFTFIDNDGNEKNMKMRTGIRSTTEAVAREAVWITAPLPSISLPAAIQERAPTESTSPW